MTQRWKIFCTLAVLYLIGFIYRISMAVVSTDLVSELGLSAAQLGVMSGIFFYVFAWAQLPLGPLLDRFGGRSVISLLGIVTTCGSLAFALAPGYWTALAGRALLGLGTACILMGSLKTFTRWFSSQEFPKVSGFIIAAGNIGSLIATLPLAYAINLLGWRETFLLMTAIQALATFAAFATIRDWPCKPSATAEAECEQPVTPADFVRIWKDLLGSIDFWLVAMIAFFWYANYMVLMALWGGPYLMEVVGMTRLQAGAILICTSTGLIIGSLLIGTAIDRLGGSLEKTILAGQALLCCTMTTLLGPADHLPAFLLGAIFFLIGLVSGSGTIIYPLARKLAPLSYAATAMTGVNFFLLMGAAVMQHFMGLYIGSFPRGPAGYPAAAYHGAFLIPICGLAVTLVLFAARRLQKGFDARA